MHFFRFSKSHQKIAFNHQFNYAIKANLKADNDDREIVLFHQHV